MGLVRVVLPCVPPEVLFFKLYYMHIHCFILDMPVQYFKSPDDIVTKKYG